MEYVALLEKLLVDNNIKKSYCKTYYTNRKIYNIIEFKPDLLLGYPKLTTIFLRNGWFFNYIKIQVDPSHIAKLINTEWIKVPKKETNKIFKKAEELIESDEIERVNKNKNKVQKNLEESILNYMNEE